MTTFNTSIVFENRIHQDVIYADDLQAALEFLDLDGATGFAIYQTEEGVIQSEDDQ